MPDEKNTLTLEKLRIYEKVDALEKAVLRIETKLFDNGVIDQVKEFSGQIQGHVLKAEKEYGKIRSVQNSQRVILILFSAISMGLLWRLFQ